MQSAQRLAWIVLVVGVLAAAANLFGPAERWGGVDIGATGATVFVLAVGVAIWLIATKESEVFAEHMSVPERRAWAGLVFLALILASLTEELLSMSRHGVVPERLNDLFARQFIQRLIMLTVAWSLVTRLIGRHADAIAEDERDLRLELRSDRAGNWALSLIVIGAIIVLASVSRDALAWWLTPMVLANVLIGLLIAKALVEHAVLAFSYRREYVGA